MDRPKLNPTALPARPRLVVPVATAPPPAPVPSGTSKMVARILRDNSQGLPNQNYTVTVEFRNGHHRAFKVMAKHPMGAVTTASWRAIEELSGEELLDITDIAVDRG